MAVAGLERLNLTRVLLPAQEAAELEVRGTTQAAVLVVLFQRDGELCTVLTERHHDLHRHAGEISFPGGRRDEADADLIATALREADEEIGLAPDRVDVLGALQPTPALASDFGVYPIVGWIAARHRWTRSEQEVASILEVKLGAIRAGYERRQVLRRGTPILTDAYVVGEHVIWGTTARILADLLDRVQLATAAD